MCVWPRINTLDILTALIAVVIDVVCTFPLLVDVNNKVSDCDIGSEFLVAGLLCGL